MTATSKAQPTPTPVPTRVSVTNHQKPDDRAPVQPQESGFPHMLMIIALVFCVLLSILGIGLLIFRRMLLPPIQIKPPTVGVGGSSWTRTLAPDPSFSGLDISSNGIQDAPIVNSVFPPLTGIDHDGVTIANTAVPLMPDEQIDTAGVSASNEETAGKLAATRSNTAWYDISDDPFTT
ncbi:hypothetical protein KDAU_34110 [Dictyobacter aurantiacus]|uniref:Uncharacterized protein n=1 Tax=Dictyobacter aurantiacus TaxID=1936993 RepID=A0A401ZGV5_9CHLR|nr:hypothetical protein KDAU_34110 [Dictyobacter aurantiacus]